MPVNSKNEQSEYRVVLFKTVTAAMKAEKLLIDARVPHKLIPVPKSISSECGICLRYIIKDEIAVLDVLKGNVEFVEIRSI